MGFFHGVLGPAEILVRLLGILRNGQLEVRNGQGQVEEKGPVPGRGDEFEGPRGEEVVRVPARCVHVVIFLDVEHCVLFPEVRPVVVVGVEVFAVAVEVIEPLSQGHAVVGGLGQAPLADNAGGVAGPIQLLRHGDVPRPEIHGDPGLGPAGIAPHGCPAVVLAGEQAAAGGHADGGPGIMLGKDHSLRGHPVERGGPDLVLPVEADVPVAKVIREDEDDVGRRGLPGCGEQARARYDGKEQAEGTCGH